MIVARGLATSRKSALQSIFSGVRGRTDAAKQLRHRDNPLYPVFKIAERFSGNWRVLNGGGNLMALVLAGCHFQDEALPYREVCQLGTVEFAACSMSLTD